MVSKDHLLTGSILEDARNLLLETVEILDRNKIIYHLEGGTLLGIVRDGDLLPWDHDIDISIPSSEKDKILKCLSKFSSLKWIVRNKYRFNTICAAWREDDCRMFKIKDRKYLFFSGRFCFDIFVKYEHEGYVYWEAKKKVMRVEKKFYESYDEIDYMGRKLKVPNHYGEYLTAKYGDWSVPRQEWDCAVDELTIVR